MRRRIKSGKGFSIIELVVVTAILVLITSVMLVSQSRFGGKVLLENLAYDIGLSVRQAQVYGISARKLGSGSFVTGAGLHFGPPPSNAYVLFTDISGNNGLYDSGASELVQSISIGSGYQIVQLCAPAGNSIATCTIVNQLDILFKRPEPDAHISTNGSSCLLSGICSTSARIVVQSPHGDRSSAIIWKNGQISVDNK